MRAGPGLYHLDAADGNHQTGDLGLLGVQGEVAEGGVCGRRAGVAPVHAGRTETSWERAAALRRCWAFWCSTTSFLQRASKDGKNSLTMAAYGDS